jgi:serine/threonine protein kinase
VTLPPGYRRLGRLHRSALYDVFDVWSDARWSRCVAKTLRRDRRDDRRARAQLLREGRRLQAMSHPHLVRAWEVHAGDPPVVILETLTGQTLAHLIDGAPLRAPEVAMLGLHIASALRYLHGAGLLHLDLKPSNVVAEAGRAVVIDLSVSRPPGHVAAGRGTWCYMAPEQARGGTVDAAADVWGLGVVLFEAATGSAAFTDTATGRPQLRAAAPPIRSLRRVPAALGGIIDGCLSPAPADRPSLADVRAALEPVAGVAGLPR